MFLCPSRPPLPPCHLFVVSVSRLRPIVEGNSCGQLDLGILVAYQINLSIVQIIHNSHNSHWKRQQQGQQLNRSSATGPGGPTTWNWTQRPISLLPLSRLSHPARRSAQPPPSHQVVVPFSVSNASSQTESFIPSKQTSEKVDTCLHCRSETWQLASSTGSCSWWAFDIQD